MLENRSQGIYHQFEVMAERARLYAEHKEKLANGEMDYDFWKKGTFFQDKKNLEPPYEFHLRFVYICRFMGIPNSCSVLIMRMDITVSRLSRETSLSPRTGSSTRR